MTNLTPEELRRREVNEHIIEILHATRRADESAVVLRHTSHRITSLNELKLHTSYIRAQSERVAFLIDDFVKKIENGEIAIEDFQMIPRSKKPGE